MSVLKRTLTIMIVVSLVLSALAVPAYAAESTQEVTIANEVELYSFSAELNSDATQAVVQSPSEEIVSFSNRRSEKNINVQLSGNEDGVFTAEGSISTVKGILEYCASGVLTKVTTESWEGLIGVLAGNASNGSPLTLSIHSIPAQNKYFVFVSLGSVTDVDGDYTYVYGDVFDEMDIMVSTYWNKFAIGNDSEPCAAIQGDGAGVYASASDYNTTYRDIGVGTGTTLSGESIDLCAVSFYSPKRVGPNESAKTYVKVNGNVGNAALYAAGKYVVPGNVETTILSGYCQLGSSSDLNAELSNLDPGDESYNVSIPIPYYTSAGFGTLPWDINIGIYTIKTNLAKHSGSIVYNIASWEHNYSKDVSWTSSGAAATKVGYAGCATLTYHNNQSKDVSFNMVAGGNVKYQYNSYVLGKNYVGSFTANANPVTVAITCDART